MSIEINGIAHIQMTLRKPDEGLPFWEKLCHHFGMQTLIRNDDTLYCIGGRTGVLVRAAPEEKRDKPFDQWTSGLHHVCFRARSRADVDAVYRFVRDELRANVVHPAEAGERFAPGYYSVLVEDPDGIRVEVNFVPGQGHFAGQGRLAPGGPGPATRYGEEGLG